MQVDPHERARFLADEALISGISSEEETWLRGHLEACADCARYAEVGANAVRGLHSISFELDPQMNARVKRAMVARAEARRGRFAPAWHWALAAAAIFLLVLPIQKYAVDAKRMADADRAATLLLEDVDIRVARTVPIAMEALAMAGSGEAK